MVDQREFVVQITEIVVHEYTVLGRTPEEAIDGAERLLEDGDEGEILEATVDEIDAVPADAYVEAGEMESDELE